MGEGSKIQWTDHTFSGWIGCEKVAGAAECDHCYAEAGTKRFAQMLRNQGKTHLPLWGADAHRHVTTDDYWKAPLRWDRAAAARGKPALVFCASQSDVFEGRVDLDASRARLADLIDVTPHLRWLLLTKRPENAAAMGTLMFPGGWPPHVWLGTSAGTMSTLRRAVPHLARVRAAVRFLSCEPLIEDLDFEIDPEATTNRFGLLSCPECRGWGAVRAGGWDDNGFANEAACSLCAGSGTCVDWIIGGGESGSAARRCELAWLERLRDQAVGAGIAFFMKQLGQRAGQTLDGDFVPYFTHDRHGGDPAEWPDGFHVREWPCLAP